MAILSTTVDATSPDFETNAAEWRRIADELRARRAEAAQGGNAKARERHVARGKLLPRERVARLIDPGSPFLELSRARRQRHV